LKPTTQMGLFEQPACKTENQSYIYIQLLQSCLLSGNRSGAPFSNMQSSQRG